MSKKKKSRTFDKTRNVTGTISNVLTIFLVLLLILIALGVWTWQFGG